MGPVPYLELFWAGQSKESPCILIMRLKPVSTNVLLHALCQNCAGRNSKQYIIHCILHMYTSCTVFAKCTEQDICGDRYEAHKKPCRKLPYKYASMHNIILLIANYIHSTLFCYHPAILKSNKHLETSS